VAINLIKKMNILDQTRQNMNEAIKHLKNELAALQVGRAQPSLVENIMVESYGTKSPLKNLAGINTPDPATISIQPWDKGIAANIEKAINESGLGLQARNDGAAIHVPIVKPTEEKRQELTKLVGKLAEEAKISIRNARQTAHQEAKKMKENGDFTEDDFYKTEKDVQEIVDDMNKEIDEIAKKKEEEVMTV